MKKVAATAAPEPPRRDAASLTSGSFPSLHRAVVLGLILALAAALRLAGLRWGLPDASHPGYSWHPDEWQYFVLARGMALGQSMVGVFMYGGTLHFSMVNAYLRYGELLHAWLGGVSPLADGLLFGRCFVVACSVLNIALVYRVGNLLYGRATGLLAAAFLALSPAHAFLAQNIRPDELSALLATLLLWLSVLILQKPADQDRLLWLAAGLLLGVTAALRFPMAAFGIGPAAACLLRHRADGWRAAAALLRWRLPLLVVAAAVGYAAASPMSLLHPDWLLRGLQLQKSFQVGDFADAAGRGPGFYQYGWLTLRQALGPLPHLLALAGVMLACLRPTPARPLLLVMTLAYFIPITTVSWVVVRYTLPVLPFLALLAADLVVTIHRQGRRPALMAATVAAASLAWTLLADLAFMNVQAGRNVRELATDWITAQVPPGASVVGVQQYNEDVYLLPVIPSAWRSYALTLGQGQEQALLQPGGFHDYVVLSGATYLNMDRLGPLDPQPGVPELQRVLLGGRFRLAAEISVPVRILGLDFSGQFTSQDFSIINPGERIYRDAAGPG